MAAWVASSFQLEGCHPSASTVDASTPRTLVAAAAEAEAVDLRRTADAPVRTVCWLAIVADYDAGVV